jgi:hypothetical protein
MSQAVRHSATRRSGAVRLSCWSRARGPVIPNPAIQQHTAG